VSNDDRHHATAAGRGSDRWFVAAEDGWDAPARPGAADHCKTQPEPKGNQDQQQLENVRRCGDFQLATNGDHKLSVDRRAETGLASRRMQNGTYEVVGGQQFEGVTQGAQPFGQVAATCLLVCQDVPR